MSKGHHDLTLQKCLNSNSFMVWYLSTSIHPTHPPTRASKKTAHSSTRFCSHTSRSADIDTVQYMRSPSTSSHQTQFVTIIFKGATARCGILHSINAYQKRTPKKMQSPYMEERSDNRDVRKRVVCLENALIKKVGDGQTPCLCQSMHAVK